MAVESCLLIWGIKRVFTVTVDNASSNDVAIAYLKKKIVGWGFSILNCKYLHMRCIAYIINLVVTDGLKETNVSVKRVREAVRYIRQSPARWNSTYLMLNAAQKFENAFDRYATIDPCFKLDLQSGDGLLDCLDWENVRRVIDLLGHFYDLTLRISGSRYVTLIYFLMRSVLLIVYCKSVASESTFGTGGRVLDSFRSSLTPKIVEALICAQDWLRKSHYHKSIEEQIADLEKLEEGLLVGDKVVELL
ncbi:hypothetical protein GH714_014265 [Hevea brasiliensis]|uniref:HAT C-terminal dimerisation domain-containing protein n=1 Tax=Hevea brasiliensis TaxID=3981 RepID=A0A6A6KIR2_HEVBR|nr:hypothetical protein GH714_014265 [Hevea brasiliensis]